MGLDKYKEKRRFDKTPEPTGGESHSDKLIFVVQKHAASHLHYDFRLELKGVLKSWAVPKGPSLNTEHHRLAQAVEDHPLDYAHFEGIIPKGQYGGGAVIIWDEGTYEPAEKIKGKKEQEHWLTSHYYKNELRIKLKGKKLKGEFLLKRNREKGENAWLLSKVEDKYASDKDITTKDKSVVSGLSIEEMAENAEASVWNSNRSGEEPSPEPALSIGLPKGVEKAAPSKIEPMLCTLIREPFTDPDWLFEVKFDGYRIIATKQKEKITLRSRKLDFTRNYKVIVEALSEIKQDLILDGEVVAVDEKGLPNFDALQSYKGDVELHYYVFDILWLDGYDLTAVPLTERREILQSILPESDVLRFSRDFEDGERLFEAVKKQGMEGVVAKRRDSTYLPGKRSSSWLKLPTKKVQDFVVGAWTESESGKAFRSLIFGNYRQGKFTYVGHVGLGFKEDERKEILERLQTMEVAKSPFSGKVETETKAHWLRPELVVIVEFATWTESGSIRKPATFKGFREDKDPKEVVPEEALSTEQEQKVVHEVTPEAEPEESTTSEESNWPDKEKEVIVSERDFPIEGHLVRITNIEKELWEEVTKAHLLQYYNSVAAYILPFIKDRPLSLHIKHVRPTAPGLYIKDMEGREPDFAEVYRMKRKHKKKGKRDIIDYLVCNNLATLWYLINLGCIDINPWASRITSPETPDFISVDLDPSDDDFSKAVQTALAAKEMFDKYKLKSFVKTSGKTGIHLLLPCSAFDFPQARSISEMLCKEISAMLPDITTTEISIKHRGNKLFVDPSQNDIADTLACPYSVRPAKAPTVSTPLEWKEVNERLSPEAFNIHTIGERLKKKGDLWAGIFDPKIIAANNRTLKGFLES